MKLDILCWAGWFIPFRNKTLAVSSNSNHIKAMNEDFSHIFPNQDKCKIYVILVQYQPWKFQADQPYNLSGYPIRWKPLVSKILARIANVSCSRSILGTRRESRPRLAQPGEGQLVRTESLIQLSTTIIQPDLERTWIPRQGSIPRKIQDLWSKKIKKEKKYSRRK